MPGLGVGGIILKLEPSNIPREVVYVVPVLVVVPFVYVVPVDDTVSPEPSSLLLISRAFHVISGFD